MTFGSDWPVVTMDPRQGLHMAVTRTTPDGLPEGGWLPEQRLTLPAALTAYTRGAAFASFDEQRKGTFAAGMLADIVILSSDVFETPDRALDATVETTIFDGRIVFSRDAALTTASN